jgi:hypothetical protein
MDYNPSFRFPLLHPPYDSNIYPCNASCIFLYIITFIDGLMNMNTKLLFVAITIVATFGIMAAATGIVTITPILAQDNQTAGGNMTDGGNMTAAIDDNMTSTGG